MEGLKPPSDADRELDELRRRAYGRDPDIGVDPSAFARLRELEAAHRVSVNRRTASTSESASRTNSTLTAAPADTARAEDQEVPEPPSPAESVPQGREGPSSLVRRVTSGWRRLTGRSRLTCTGGALVAAGAILATVVAISAPRPDATLHRTAVEADSEVRRLVAEQAAWLKIDTATLSSYGTYLGLEIWSGVNAFDSPCLVALHRANFSLSESCCAPSAAALIMDVSSSGDGFDGFPGITDDGIIRFMAHGDAVDAFVYVMPEAD